MFDRVRAIEMIEGALDSDPFCPACGAPTQIVDRAGHVLLVCSTLSQPRSRIGRVLAAIVPHLRTEIVDLSGTLAA